MQHDLRIEETRLDTPALYYWCLCGSWSGEAPTLHRKPVYQGFIEHLAEIRAERAEIDEKIEAFRKRVGLQPDDQGHWG